MPIDRYHAFAEGPVFGPKARRRFFARSSDPEARAADAWRQFRATSTVARTVRLGPSAWCMNGRRDPRFIEIGTGAICRGLLKIESFGEGRIVIGEEVYLGDDTILSASAGIEIGARTLIAHGVQIFDNDSHPTARHERETDYAALLRGGARAPIPSAAVRIGAGVWIGLNCIVLKGVTIGDGAVIAAGSVVSRDVAPSVVAAGIPAKTLHAI